MNIFLYLSIKDLKVTKKINIRYTAAAAAIFLVVMIYGIIRSNNFQLGNDKVKVGLIQPNINPWKKWDKGNLNEQLDLYLSLSEKAVNDGAKLIVWPESALPVYLLSGNYERQVDRIKQFVSSKNIFLLTGMPDVNIYFNKSEAPADAKKTRSGVSYTSYNSVLLFSPKTSSIQKYGKIMLVPFGEHVPFVEQLPFLGDFIKWEVGISSWNIGKEQIVF